MLPLWRFNHRDPGGMPAAFECGGQKRIHDVQGQSFADDAHADRQHIGIIMLADHPGGKCIGANATADTRDFVCGHHDALTSAAQDNAEPAVTRRDPFGGRYAMLRVRCAFWCRWPDVHRVPAAVGDMIGDGLSQLNGGVVTGQDDASVIGHLKGAFYEKGK